MPGSRSSYIVDPSALMFLLCRAARPLSVRIISRELLGGKDRAIKPIKIALTVLIAQGRVKPVPFSFARYGKTYEHYIATGVGTMAEYQIEAQAKGTTVKSIIITDDPQRAIRFTKLLAATGHWDNVEVRANKTTYTIETLHLLK